VRHIHTRGEVSPNPIDGAQPSADRTTAGFSRRTMLKGIAGAGLAATLAGLPLDAAAAAAQNVTDWPAFDAAVSSEFSRMGMVGSALAVVTGDQVLHTHTLGVRSLKHPDPVTHNTHFPVASTTKSMSSLLVATFVDQKRLAWDQPVIDAWPGFRAPTDHLTKTLRVRDLMGMASGIGEPTAFGLHQGLPTATELLQSLVNLPVINEPNKEFFYNNTVYAAGGYLPLLVEHVAGNDLEAAYSEAMRDRVYGPVGMATASIADDPRGVVDDYAGGHSLDLDGKATMVQYGPVGAYAPVGGTLACLDDMVAYVQMQLRRGMSVTGKRVVSEANLAETHKPHIAEPTDKALDPDTVSAHYCMGWVNQQYTDGNTLLWHNGGIDGFTSFIGFMPGQDLGLVVLNNINPSPTGFYFYLYALTLILNGRLGLNKGVPEKIDAANTAAVAQLKSLGQQSRPVDPAVLAPFLGYYEGGYQLVLHGAQALIVAGPRLLPLAAMPDGSYVFSGGLIAGSPVKLVRGRDGVPQMELVALSETVRRTVGLD
jgi:CubicO group peptidase (beta-lactamase class C family)